MKTGKQSPENCKIECKWVLMNLQYLEMEMGFRK